MGSGTLALAGCTSTDSSTATSTEDGTLSETATDTPSPSPSPTDSPTPEGTPIQTPSSPREIEIPRQTIDIDDQTPNLDNPGISIRDDFFIFQPWAYGRNPINNGNVWLRYDDTNLYFVAIFDDESHSNSYRADELWKGDCIQFGFAGGEPGQSLQWNEVAIAKTDDGTDRTYNYVYEINGQTGDTGTIEDPNLNVSRDGTTTIYKFGFPWVETYSDASPEHDYLAINIGILNNNGDGHVGLTEWAGGIFGNKNVADYGTGELLD
jgi:hypothetical protein